MGDCVWTCRSTYEMGQIINNILTPQSGVFYDALTRSPHCASVYLEIRLTCIDMAKRIDSIVIILYFNTIGPEMCMRFCLSNNY